MGYNEFGDINPEVANYDVRTTGNVINMRANVGGASFVTSGNSGVVDSDGEDLNACWVTLQQIQEIRATMAVEKAFLENGIAQESDGIDLNAEDLGSVTKF